MALNPELLVEVRKHREWYEKRLDEMAEKWAGMFGGPLIPPAVEEPPPGVAMEELVQWFLDHAWRAGSQGWQEVVERFLKEYVVTKR